MRFVFVDGEIRPAEEANISVFDRGFLYGEAVFTTVKIKGGVPLFWERHVWRLAQAMRELEFGDLTYTRDARAALDAVVKANELSLGAVRVTLTRGPDDGGPVIIAQARPMPERPAAFDVVTVPESRDAVRHVKTVNRATSMRARSLAQRSGAHEAVFVADGSLVEGTIHNLFAVIGDKLVTPPLDGAGLPGIVRNVLVERLSLELRPIPEHTAGPLFLTNSLTGVASVATLDGRLLERDVKGERELRRVLEALEEESLREELEASAPPGEP